MKTIDQWLSEYGVSHQNAVNKMIHYFCVPAIFLSVVGLLWAIPVPLETSSDWINWATLAAIIISPFYFRLSIIIGLGMTVFSIACLAVIHWWANNMQMSVLSFSLVVFIVAWVLQFVGHHIEGKKPSFLKDLQFLLVGPAWILCALFGKLNIKY